MLYIIILAVLVFVLYVSVIFLARKIAIIKDSNTFKITQLVKLINKILMQRERIRLNTLPKNLQFTPGKIYVNTATKEQATILEVKIDVTKNEFDKYVFYSDKSTNPLDVTLDIPQIKVFFTPENANDSLPSSLEITEFRRTYKALPVSQQPQTK